MNIERGYQWRAEILYHTQPAEVSEGKDCRPLFLNGHKNHLKMMSIDFCHKNKILLMAYPPHSTHRLPHTTRTTDHLCAIAQHQELQTILLQSRLALQNKQSKGWKTHFYQLRTQTDTNTIIFSPRKVRQADALVTKMEEDKESETE